MRRLNSLYAKIFGWFWLTLTFGSLTILAVTAFTGSRPLGVRWMRLTQDMYAHSAVDFYETGGAPALAQYLTVLHHSSGIDARLLDASQHDLLGGALPPHVGLVLATVLRTGHSNFRLGRTWSAASPVHYGDHSFIFVAEVRPAQGFLDGTFATALSGPILLAILVAGIFCWLLTRHIVGPVRALKDAALRMAAGDLSSRVLPAIAPRDDELADTAYAFDQMADRLEAMVQQRHELLADISHELRSPLTRLSVSLELMRRGETDVLEQMQTDLDRMNAMIAQILLLTRLNLETSPSLSELVDLPPMLESIAHDAQFEGKQTGKTVTLALPPACTLRGDANLLRSCIENIVRNALRYTEPGTAVRITLTLLPSSLCQIHIVDSGPGVPAAALPYLFDPFFRVSESRARTDGGFGLGLSISQKVTALHGGRILAGNRTDRPGLAILLTLPCL